MWDLVSFLHCAGKFIFYVKASTDRLNLLALISKLYVLGLVYSGIAFAS